jgi:hypothetical protein
VALGYYLRAEMSMPMAQTSIILIHSKNKQTPRDLVHAEVSDVPAKFLGYE